MTFGMFSPCRLWLCPLQISGSLEVLGCRKWGGCNEWGLKGCLAALPENRPKSAFFVLFCLECLFPRGPNSIWEIQKTEEKGLFPQTCSDLLQPPSLKPPFAALQPGSFSFDFFGILGRFPPPPLPTALSLPHTLRKGRRTMNISRVSLIVTTVPTKKDH